VSELCFFRKYFESAFFFKKTSLRRYAAGLGFFSGLGYYKKDCAKEYVHEKNPHGIKKDKER
jgi:hypothetical protein